MTFLLPQLLSGLGEASRLLSFMPTLGISKGLLLHLDHGDAKMPSDSSLLSQDLY